MYTLLGQLRARVPPLGGLRGPGGVLAASQALV